MRNSALGTLGILASVVAYGCAGSDAPGAASAPEAVVRDSAGITIVSNGETGVWTDENRWRVTEELRIGTMTGDPAYQFAGISGIAELSDGSIAVMDAQAQELRLFASDGTHRQTIGGPGSGPGEFGIGAGPVLVGPGDSLYIPDPTNQRLNQFTPMAEPVASTPLDFTDGIPLVWLDTPDGLLVNQVRPFAFPGQEMPEDPTDLILARGSDGSVIDTLISFPAGQTFQQTADGLPEITFFSPEPAWTLTSDSRVAYGYSDTYRFGIYEDQELVRLVERPYHRDPVTERDQDILRTAMSNIWRDAGMPPQILQVMTDGIGFAELYPAYAFLRGGPEGSIWVQHLRTPSDLPEDQRDSFDPQLGFGGTKWDVFRPDGVFLGELELPDRFTTLRIDGDRVYGVLRDELDVQYVLALRVHWNAEDLESGAQ